MTQRNYVKPLVLRNVDTAEIAADTWTAFSGDVLEGACFFIRITNTSNADISISFDGVNEHEFLTADDRININFQSNASPSGYVAKLANRSVLYVRGAAGVGLVYLSGYFNELY